MAEYWIPYSDVELMVELPSEKVAWTINRLSISLDVGKKLGNLMDKLEEPLTVILDPRIELQNINRLISTFLESFEKIEFMYPSSPPIYFYSPNDLLTYFPAIHLLPPGGFQVYRTELGFKLELPKFLSEKRNILLLSKFSPNPIYVFSGLDLLPSYMASENSFPHFLRALSKFRGKLSPIDFWLQCIPDNLSMLWMPVVSNSEGIYGVKLTSLDSSLSIAIKEFEEVLWRTSKEVGLLIVGSGHPYDYTFQYILQVLLLSLEVLHKDGHLVIAAECERGFGDLLYNSLINSKRGGLKPNTVIDLYLDMFMKMREGFNISLVSVLPNFYLRRLLRLSAHLTLQDAVGRRYNIVENVGILCDGFNISPTSFPKYI